MNGIELYIVNQFASPDEIITKKEICSEMRNSILKLSKKQAKRLIRRYYMNMSIVAIAWFENVDESSVRDSIKRGLSNIKKDFDLYIYLQGGFSKFESRIIGRNNKILFLQQNDTLPKKSRK